MPEFVVLVPVCGEELVLELAAEPAVDPVCGAALEAISTVDPSDAVGPLPEVEQ